jgi:hypothetical protein
MTKTSITAFASDFHDEGIGPALDNIQQRAGVAGVSLAAVYHHARDIFPHNPVRRVRFLEGGRAFFNLDPARYSPDGIRPVTSSYSPDWDALAELRAATRARGMSLHAWTVFTHNSLLGSLHPEAVVENVFGDPQLTALCPANPVVVRFCRELAADIARYEVESILAESLHFDMLEHGYHHERYLLEIGPIDRLLLGLCFCQHCRIRAARAGVDVASLVAVVAARLNRLFESASAYDGSAADLATVAGLWNGELLAFLHARESAVSELAAEVMDSLRGSGTALAIIDPAGALKGYADGRPTGGPASEVSWKVGVDPAQLSQSCDELVAVGYAADPGRVRMDLESYRALISDRCGLRVALRPMAPDCLGWRNLAEKVGAIDGIGAAGMDFYHYGFLRLEDLDVIKMALRTRAGAGETEASCDSPTRLPS